MAQQKRSPVGTDRALAVAHAERPTDLEIRGDWISVSRPRPPAFVAVNDAPLSASAPQRGGVAMDSDDERAAAKGKIRSSALAGNEPDGGYRESFAVAVRGAAVAGGPHERFTSALGRLLRPQRCAAHRRTSRNAGAAKWKVAMSARRKAGRARRWR
jgi:hypothetical protein